jgi:CBS domain-containing protein
MASVRDILRRKGSDVFTASGDISVHEVCRVMTNRGIGSVVILEGGAVAGIVTERDVLRRVVAQGLDPAITQLANIMTRAPLLTCTPDSPLDDVRSTMSSRRIRHMPVVGPDGLAGLVTIGDLVAYQLADQEVTIQQLQGFVYDNR